MHIQIFTKIFFNEFFTENILQGRNLSEYLNNIMINAYPVNDYFLCTHKYDDKTI